MSSTLASMRNAEIIGWCCVWKGQVIETVRKNTETPAISGTGCENGVGRAIEVMTERCLERNYVVRCCIQRSLDGMGHTMRGDVRRTVAEGAICDNGTALSANATEGCSRAR